MPMSPQQRFASCARWYDPFLSALAPVLVFYYYRDSDLSNHALTILLILSATLPVCFFEFLTQRRNFVPRPVLPVAHLFSNIVIKWLGLQLGIFFMLLYWWLFPLYDVSYYVPFFEVLPEILPWLALTIFVVVAYSEWRLGELPDHSWQLGMLALGRWRDINLPVLKTAGIALLVRAIFLPMNFAALYLALNQLRKHTWQWEGLSFADAHLWAMKIPWALLIVAIVPGYLFSMRILGTSVKKADASWFGWVVTMACYPPLLAGVFGLWLRYNPEPSVKQWVVLTQDFPMLMLIVGAIILAMELGHWWGEAIMGIRASNLTHRGVITNGPFRLTRHPIYVFKCIGWLFIVMPFAAGSDALECLRLTLLWGGVCALYFARAWAEERLFADDPLYIEYALWMDKYGWLAWVGRIFPPATFAWKLKRWKENGAISRETVP